MIRNFFRDETGLELSEYAVAAALVAIAAVIAFTTLGNAISTKINVQPSSAHHVAGASLVHHGGRPSQQRASNSRTSQDEWSALGNARVGNAKHSRSCWS